MSRFGLGTTQRPFLRLAGPPQYYMVEPWNGDPGEQLTCQFCMSEASCTVPGLTLATLPTRPGCALAIDTLSPTAVHRAPLT